MLQLRDDPLTAYQAVLAQSGVSYELFVRGLSGDDVKIHEYGYQTTFRHPMLGRRLYAEWLVGYTFPREDLSDRRKGSVEAGLGIEMPFGTAEEKQ